MHVEDTVRVGDTVSGECTEDTLDSHPLWGDATLLARIGVLSWCGLLGCFFFFFSIFCPTWHTAIARFHSDFGVLGVQTNI